MPDSLVHRIQQTFLALYVRQIPAIPDTLFSDDLVRRLFVTLSAHDQRHLLAVHRKARQRGYDELTCSAALLHDVGKASLAGRHVSVMARILNVVQESVRVGNGSTGPPLQIDNYALNRSHGALGAARLRALGLSESVCALVEMHDCPDPTDERLIRLQQLDNTTP